MPFGIGVGRRSSGTSFFLDQQVYKQISQSVIIT